MVSFHAHRYKIIFKLGFMILFLGLHISLIGRGFFKMHFKIADQASAILAQSHVDFYMAMRFFDGWTYDMNLTGMDVGLVITTIFL